MYLPVSTEKGKILTRINILNEFCAEKTLTAVCWPISGINLPRYPRYAGTVLANCPLMVSLYGGCCNTTHYHHQIGSLLDISTSMFKMIHLLADGWEGVEQPLLAPDVLHEGEGDAVNVGEGGHGRRHVGNLRRGVVNLR